MTNERCNFCGILEEHGHFEWCKVTRAPSPAEVMQAVIADMAKAALAALPAEPEAIRCPDCGKTPDVDVTIHWQHECVPQNPVREARMNYEPIILQLRPPHQRFINAYRWARHWNCSRWAAVKYGWKMARMKMRPQRTE